MILDSSAVLAILRHEPERDTYASLLTTAEVRRVSAATLVELSIVVESQSGAVGVQGLDDFLREIEIVIEPVSEEQAYIARRAWTIYGRGKHPARLNFGDCFSYALAKALDEPLLFKGSDFAKTDVQPAV